VLQARSDITARLGIATRNALGSRQAKFLLFSRSTTSYAEARSKSVNEFST
jgi:hypothetical protein